MSSLTYCAVPAGTAAAVRNARALHLVRFTSDTARAPELKKALPELGWSEFDGKPTLPPGDVVKIASLTGNLDLAVADTKRVFGDFPQLEEISRIWDLVFSKVVLTGERACRGLTSGPP